ncbi:MAG: hypothetical protein CL555_13725 [Algoriphagus sp.]|nr:hypothetical protein [Algoriphagus sp.]
MKKYLLILGFGLLMISNVQAQSGIGFRGGVNIFNFGGSDVSENDYTNRAGFHAGIYANFLPDSPVSLEPGVFYSVKGTQNNDALNSRAILNYVDVPVLLRLKAGDSFNIFAGPQVSFLLDSKFEGDFGSSTVSLQTSNVRDLDTGLVFGIGFNPASGLNLQGSYDFGMTPVFKDSDADVYNRGFKISLGISL